MFDGRWRQSFEEGLKPVGANLRRTGITADHLTATGVVLAAAASVAIANGALRGGLLLLVLCALPDLLDGAVAKASGTAGPRGAFFDSVSDRVTDALLLGGVAWYLATTHPGRIAVLPMAVLAASMLISYERAKAESLGFDARGGLMERAERIIAPRRRPAVRLAPHRRPLGHARAHADHRRAAVRQGVAAGQRHPTHARRRAVGGPGGPPAPPSAPGAASSAPPAGSGVGRGASGLRGRPRHSRLQDRRPPGAAAPGTRSRPPVREGSGGSPVTWPRDRRAQVERNLRRVDPTLHGPALQRLVDQTFESYARYYEESFRLPGTSAADLDAGFQADGWHRLDAALEQGTGAIMALPHLGGWEWSGFWVTQVQHRAVTAVVERLDPPELFEWFADLRRSFGFEVVALGPGAGPATAKALKANHTLALLCDRDLTGTGPEVDLLR